MRLDRSKKPKIKNQRALGLKDQMPFGKYRGEYVCKILNKNAQYIMWASSNNVLTFDKDVHSLLRVSKTERYRILRKKKLINYKPSPAKLPKGMKSVEDLKKELPALEEWQCKILFQLQLQKIPPRKINKNEIINFD